jgi:hypothetical protein
MELCSEEAATYQHTIYYKDTILGTKVTFVPARYAMEACEGREGKASQIFNLHT